MENQNLNDFEQNTNSTNTNKPQKGGNVKTIVLVVILLLLMLAIGVLVGMMLSGKGNTIINKTQEIVKGEDENKKDNTQEISNEEGYSQTELEKMALDYYEAKTGYRPKEVASEINQDGTISIQLYDNMGNHNSTSEWYTVNSKTGIGTNISGDKIDLKVKPSKDTNDTSVSNEIIWYKNDIFKIKLPKSWENKYVVEIGDIGVNDGGGDSYNFRTKNDNEFLFSIEVRKKAVEGQTPHRYLGTYADENYDTFYVYIVERQDSPVNAEPYTSMIKDFEKNKDDVYIKYIFQSVEDGNNNRKTIYVKNFTTLLGSMYKYMVYYISENDELCIVDFKNGVTVEVIASDTKKLEYDENENVIHAYPIGNSFMNNIAREVEEIVFEKIN